MVAGVVMVGSRRWHGCGGGACCCGGGGGDCACLRAVWINYIDLAFLANHCRYGHQRRQTRRFLLRVQVRATPSPPASLLSLYINDTFILFSGAKTPIHLSLFFLFPSFFFFFLGGGGWGGVVVLRPRSCTIDVPPCCLLHLTNEPCTNSPTCASRTLPSCALF